MMLSQLTLEFERFLIKLLAALQGFLLKLLPTRGKLLFKLYLLGLHVVLHLSGLLSGALEKLFALLANLISHLIDLTLSFLSNRSSTDKLLALKLGFLNNFVGLTTRRRNEFVLLLQQLIRLRNLPRE